MLGLEPLPSNASISRSVKLASCLLELTAVHKRSVVLLVLAGCVGEASVSYQGSVNEGDTNHLGFSSRPGEGTPIPGATVTLLFGDNRVEDAATDANGLYAEIEGVFGGFVGVDTEVEVLVRTLDGRESSYTTVYEDTDDPTIANAACSELDDPTSCRRTYLNFVLAPL
jgi:hypothetical protein